MEKCNTIVTIVALGSNLGKDDKGLLVSPTLYKRLVASLM